MDDKGKPFARYANARLVIDWRVHDVVIDGWDRGGPYTFAEYHGLVDTFLLRNDLYQGTYDAIKEDEEVKRLIALVREGFNSEWNGSTWVGRFTADAQEALDELEDYLEDHWGDEPKAAGEPGDFSIWDADAWFQGGLDDEFAKGETFDELAARLEAEADNESSVVLDLDRYVRARYADWLDKREED